MRRVLASCRPACCGTLLGLVFVSSLLLPPKYHGTLHATRRACHVTLSPLQCCLPMLVLSSPARAQAPGPGTAPSLLASGPEGGQDTTGSVPQDADPAPPALYCALRRSGRTCPAAARPPGTACWRSATRRRVQRRPGRSPALRRYWRALATRVGAGGLRGVPFMEASRCLRVPAWVREESGLAMFRRSVSLGQKQRWPMHGCQPALRQLALPLHTCF